MYKKLFLISCLLVTQSLLAGSTGFVYQGKTYYLFKDGLAIDEEPEYIQAGRTPASLNDQSSMRLYFTEDDLVRCYYWDKSQGKQSLSKDKNKESNIHCFKLTDLK